MNCPKCGYELSRDEIAKEFAAIGGKAKSQAKTIAARKNAKKGGWPKGRPRNAAKRKGEK